MNMLDLIYKKRDGGKLSKEEIEYFVTGYTQGSVPDYQASAFLMSIFFNKLDREETYLLTAAMKHSGSIIDLSRIGGIKVDKHSTGGVGDKTTFVAAPIAAAAGIPVAKMSGRGLGFTGGTVDKMESIPGFQTALAEEDFINLVNRVGLSVIGQTAHVAPADKKIYALRDATATVEDLSLITASIMSKKLASGSDAIVLDVKCGSGAFMESFEDACRLGQLMVDIGKADGKRTIAVITDMSQPLGYAVGNSLEVIEAIETLRGCGPWDITELSLVLAGFMIYAGGKAKDGQEGRKLAEEALHSGAALATLKAFIEGQGGDSRIMEDYGLFSPATSSVGVTSDQDGYIGAIGARAVGFASQHAGAGRATKEDTIDMTAGVCLHKKVGDRVCRGDLLGIVCGNDRQKVARGAKELERAFRIDRQPPQAQELVRAVLE